MTRFDHDRISRIHDCIAGHVAHDRVGGVAWLAACGDDVQFGAAGRLTRTEASPVARDSIFRISSMTKPIVAVAALLLVEEFGLRLEERVDDLLPELADRRVLLDPLGPVDGDTEPARRPITVHDVLTFRLGLGMDFAAPFPQPLIEAMDALGIGTAPPAPQVPPDPDEWMAQLSTLPLLYQPGDHWLYHVGADVLGVLVARASGQPLDAFLRDRVFAPLGMRDTAFATPDVRRFGSCYMRDPTTKAPVLFDPPDGQWASAPKFPSGGGGLVSTVDDLHAFGRMLLDGGRLPDGTRLLSRASVAAMTTDHLGVAGGAPGPSPDGSSGWGLGVGVLVRNPGLGPGVGAYGWTGGLGSVWANDPATDVVGIVLSTDAFEAPFPPPQVIQDFWTGVYAALDD
jgi:CubicO group peptidase (beta-lactamase class C family)